MTNKAAATTRVTLRDVAKQAGVSYTQASFVLNGTNLQCVSLDRQKRVWQAIEELNYRPNRAARQMVRQRTHTIGYFISREADRGSILPAQINGLYDACHANGYSLSLLRLTDQELADGALPQWVREICIDGLIVHESLDQISPSVKQLIDSVQVPVIWINDKQPQDCVHFDEVACGRLATEVLLHQGHQRIDYLCTVGPNHHHSYTDRGIGYEQAITKASFESHCHIQRVPRNDRLQLIQRLLTQSNPPTAIVCSYYDLAVYVRYVAIQLGLAPEQLGISTIVSTPIPIGSLYDIRMVHVSQETLADQSFNALQQKIENPGAPLSPVVVMPTVISS